MSASQLDLSLSGESSSRQSIRKKNKGGRCDEIFELVAKKLQSSSEGKFSAYAKYIAQELETIPKEMAIYCQRVINGAIFKAHGFIKQNVTCNNRPTLFDTTTTVDRPTNIIPFLYSAVLRWTIFFTLSGVIFQLPETVSN